MRSSAVILLASVVIASGCVQTEMTDLKPDFDTDHNATALPEPADEIYESTMAEVERISSYRVEADNRMAMNIPVVSFSANMTSSGVYRENYSKINSSETLNFNLAGRSNSTEFTTRVETSGDTSTVTRSGEIMEKESYSQERLGISLEALEAIEVENVTALGTTHVNGEESILLEPTFNSTELMKNSENVFEVHSPIKESSERGQSIEQVGKFNRTESYLWVDRESYAPLKFAYYGSTSEGALQIRSVTEFSYGGDE